MLVTPANLTGLIVFRRQPALMTEIPLLSNSHDRYTIFTALSHMAVVGVSKTFRCGARRRVRDDIGGEEEEEEESYGYNEEIAMLEIYSQSCREEALIVTAIVDDEEVEVLIFKGMSSCLSGETAVDPAKSVLPERALIKKIDRVRGPFDPSNIHYIQEGLSFQAFKDTFLN